MIPTVRAFVTGNSGSGKTTTAWKLYLAKFPRCLILDQTGEWYGRCDVYTSTLGTAVDAMRKLAPRTRWRVAYTLDDDRFPELVQWLIPVPNVYASPILMCGGAVLLVDEVDLLAPGGFGGAPQEIRTLYRRSRHVGLSIVSATQRPANVSREVSAQSSQIIAHYLSEPRDRDYMADIMRWTPEQLARWIRWCQQHPHGAVWKEVQTGRLLLLPENGAPLAWSEGDAHDVARHAVPAKLVRPAAPPQQAPVSDQQEPQLAPRQQQPRRPQLLDESEAAS